MTDPSLSPSTALFLEDITARIADRTAVLVVGSGVSAGATGGDELATWTGLLKNGVARCEQVAPGLAKSWGDVTRQEINSGDLDDLLAAAEKVSAKLNARSGEYSLWLRESVGQLKVIDNRTIRAIAALDVPVVTTNYDSLIEEVTGWSTVTWRQPVLVERVIRSHERSVFHLHGHWRDPDSVVLGLRSYALVLGDRHTQAILQALRAARTFVFVGFGAGLGDPTFSALMQWGADVFSGTEYRQYRLVRGDDLKHAQGPTQITTISYGDTHEDLAGFLGRLRPSATTGSLAPRVPISTFSGRTSARSSSPRSRSRSSRSTANLPLPSADPTRLPRSLAADIDLVGRDKDVKQLKTAWAAENVSVVAVTGQTGMGKTFLVDAFIRKMREWERDLPEIFLWHFFNQDTRSFNAWFKAGSMAFFEHALKRWDIAVSSMDPAVKRDALVRHISSRRVLLVLDGIETLQSSRGEFRDDEQLAEFLQTLCDIGFPKGGLIILTSRYPPRDLIGRPGYADVKLKPIDSGDGARLLQRLGVFGDDKEREKASTDFGGNPACLLWLGRWLSERCYGDLAFRNRVKPPDDGSDGRWATAVIESYEKALTLREREFMRLLGLFGRPMKEEDLRTLKGDGARVPSAGHYAGDDLHGRRSARALGSLVSLSDTDWNRLYDSLARLSLLTGDGGPGHPWTYWETHALLRTYFGDQLMTSDPEAWREAHQFLFDHYDGCTTRATHAEDLPALYGAMFHGCFAGSYTEALKLYRVKVADNFNGFDTEVAGATSETLLALSAFFGDIGFTKIKAILSDYDTAWLLARVSYCLVSRGDLRISVAPRIQSNQILATLFSGTDVGSLDAFKRAIDVAYGCEELTNAEMLLGRLHDAHEHALQAVTWADEAAKCDTRFRESPNYKPEPKLKGAMIDQVPAVMRQWSTRSALGAALRSRGALAEAEQAFQQATRQYRRYQKDAMASLHSEPGFRYCLLKLEMARSESDCRQILEHARHMSDWWEKEQQSSRGSRSATRTIRGLHAAVEIMASLRFELSSDSRKKLGTRLDQALEWIIQSKKSQFECELLMTRAQLRRSLNDRQAADDLERVLTIASRGEMRLVQADANLLKAHIALDHGDLAAARSCEQEALRLVGVPHERDHYRLRDAEMHLLTARLLYLTGDKQPTMERELERARVSYTDIQQWRVEAQWLAYRRGDWGS